MLATTIGRHYRLQPCIAGRHNPFGCHEPHTGADKRSCVAGRLNITGFLSQSLDARWRHHRSHIRSFTTHIDIGYARIMWDSDNNALKVINKNPGGLRVFLCHRFQLSPWVLVLEAVERLTTGWTRGLPYDSGKAGWVLSAALGYGLHGRVSTLESSTPNIAWGVAGSGYIPPPCCQRCQPSAFNIRTYSYKEQYYGLSHIRMMTVTILRRRSTRCWPTHRIGIQLTAGVITLLAMQRIAASLHIQATPPTHTELLRHRWDLEA